jgi:hypothetical protein
VGGCGEAYGTVDHASPFAGLVPVNGDFVEHSLRFRERGGSASVTFTHQPGDAVGEG